MNRKRISIAALMAVAAVMSVTIAVFASAAPNGGAEAASGQKAPGDGYVYNHFQAVEGDVMILSQGGEDGEKQYSVDGGKTWLSEEDYRAQYGGSDWQVEWWTAEDYAVWLEEEKQVLQSIIGERGYTSSEGWFTWDQKQVDESIALYESILENIKNGALYSKTITDPNGGAVEDVMLGSGTQGETAVFASDEKDAAAPEAIDEAALLEELKPFGVTGGVGHLTYKGQSIRYLVDGVPAGDSGYSIQYLYANPDGAIDVHTLRSATRNPDGSYDPMGKLTGVAAEGDPGFDWPLVESAAFDRGTQEAVTVGNPGFDWSLVESTASSGGTQEAVAEGNGGEGGTSFEEIFARYRSFGLVYSPRESGMGSLTWNSQAVKSFADLKPDGGAFSYQDPYAKSGLRVYAVYGADGTLTALREG